MCAQERLLHRLVGVGLRPEQRHGQPAEHRAVRARARAQRVAVQTVADHDRDRIRFDHRVGVRLHLHPHVRRARHFVTCRSRIRPTPRKNGR
jgi:hypothetical protein